MSDWNEGTHTETDQALQTAQRQGLFPQQVIDVWNPLPQAVVKARVSRFKKKLVKLGNRSIHELKKENRHGIII